MEFLGIGLPELLLIAVAALVILGPDRLPEAMSKLGQFIRQFRALTNGVTDQFARELQIEELRRQTTQIYDETRQATNVFSVPRSPASPALPARSAEAFDAEVVSPATPVGEAAPTPAPEPVWSDPDPTRAVAGGVPAENSQTRLSAPAETGGTPPPAPTPKPGS